MTDYCIQLLTYRSIFASFAAVQCTLLWRISMNSSSPSLVCIELLVLLFMCVRIIPQGSGTTRSKLSRGHAERNSSRKAREDKRDSASSFAAVFFFSFSYRGQCFVKGPLRPPRTLSVFLNFFRMVGFFERRSVHS